MASSSSSSSSLSLTERNCKRLFLEDERDAEEDEEVGHNPLRRLPFECLLRIVGYLDTASIGQFSLACRFCYRVANDNLLWKHLYDTRPFFPGVFEERWRDVYDNSKEYATKSVAKEEEEDGGAEEGGAEEEEEEISWKARYMELNEWYNDFKKLTWRGLRLLREVSSPTNSQWNRQGADALGELENGTIDDMEVSNCFRNLHVPICSACCLTPCDYEHICVKVRGTVRCSAEDAVSMLCCQHNLLDLDRGMTKMSHICQVDKTASVLEKSYHTSRVILLRKAIFVEPENVYYILEQSLPSTRSTLHRSNCAFASYPHYVKTLLFGVQGSGFLIQATSPSTCKISHILQLQAPERFDGNHFMEFITQILPFSLNQLNFLVTENPAAAMDVSDKLMEIDRISEVPAANNDGSRSPSSLSVSSSSSSSSSSLHISSSPSEGNTAAFTFPSPTS